MNQAYLASRWSDLTCELHADETLTFELAGEDSAFMRFNAAKVRQMGTVKDAELTLRYFLGQAGTPLRELSCSVTLSGDPELDHRRLEAILRKFRDQVPALPANPFAQLPTLPSEADASSTDRFLGTLLNREGLVETILSPVQGSDFTGIYGGGRIVRAGGSSLGTFHWYEAETFTLDYSLIGEEGRAVKGEYAGRIWDSGHYRAEVERCANTLQVMRRPVKKLERGTYRAYLAPAAVADLIAMFSWGMISERSIRQGDSCLRRVRSGERSFSPLFSLSEDFTSGLAPRFNDRGELAPLQTPLVAKGSLVGTLVSSSTAKEYGVESNRATEDERLRSAVMAPGQMNHSEILSRLDTGVYLSNLHYLNWSDMNAGRITGLTRFACFWVEKGEIVAPLETMRWDESIFEFFGDGLEALTDTVAVIPDSSTYGGRALGGTVAPGALIRSMHFTL